MRLAKLALLAPAIALIAWTQSSAAATSCELAVDLDSPVTYVDGHIPVIVVKILDQEMKLMVDSGSASSFITNAAYNRLHLNQTDNIPGYSTWGLGGRVDVSGFALVNMSFGAVRLEDEVVGILSRPISAASGPNAIDGIMGYDILQSFDVGLDLPHNRITLYSPQHCTLAETPWEGDYAPMPFRRPQGASPVVAETIDDKTFNVVIDTGADHSLIMQASLNRNGVVPELPPAVLTKTGSGIGGLKVHFTMARFSWRGSLFACMAGPGHHAGRRIERSHGRVAG